MTSLEEFHSIFIKFREMYEECSSLIANGIDLETADENMVSWKLCNDNIFCATQGDSCIKCNDAI